MQVYYHSAIQNPLLSESIWRDTDGRVNKLTANTDILLWEYQNESATDNWQLHLNDQISIALLITDYESFQSDPNIDQFLKAANYIVVPTIAAKRDLLLNHQVSGGEVFTYEFRDLPVDWKIDNTPNFTKNIQQNTVMNQPNEVCVKALHENGGWGLVTDKSKFNVSLKTSYFLAAGIPIIAFHGSAVAQLVSKYHLGLVIDNGDDPQKTINQIDSQAYGQFVKNVSKIGLKIRKGHFTRRLLNEALYHVIVKPQVFMNYSSIYRPAKFNLNVMDSIDTAKFIAENHCSVARLGDGEISLLKGFGQVFQNTDPLLQQRLDQIVKKGSSSKLLVCLSDVFHGLDMLVPGAQDWWAGHLNSFKSYYKELGQRGQVYGNTMVTRPYMDFIDRSGAKDVFAEIRQWWENRDLLIVEGYYTRSGVGNDLYANAHSVQRIICPSKNAWSKHHEIEKLIKKYGQGKLVLVMLGMAATVIAADLSDWGQVIDLGHLDPEYEWFKMGATERVPIVGKHTAEMNYDQNIDDLHNTEFNQQIIANLSGQEEK